MINFLIPYLCVQELQVYKYKNLNPQFWFHSCQKWGKKSIFGTIFRRVLAEKWTPNQKTRLHSCHFQGQERRRCSGFDERVRNFWMDHFFQEPLVLDASFKTYIYTWHLCDTIMKARSRFWSGQALRVLETSLHHGWFFRMIWIFGYR